MASPANPASTKPLAITNPATTNPATTNHASPANHTGVVQSHTPLYSRGMSLSRFFLSVAMLLPAAVSALDFDRDIQPILSDKCFHCHGPDGATREADLRMDTREGATLVNKHGEAAIVPGKPEDSIAMHRILTDDPDDLMPPPDSNRSLSKKEKEMLRQWIADGAEWSEHWAFIKPEAAKINTSNRDWKRNAIDQLVLAKVSENGLVVNAEADPETLLRRLTLDLTGLAPTPEEQVAYLADSEDSRYEKAVDRLLDSQHYGERMAWPWLDLARYSDSNGYQHDADRTMYPWRDWVVRAFNDNMSFDEFTVWQLAGDLLEKPTFDQRLATAFLRNSMINGEGGRIAEENRVEYIFDHLETVGTAWLALTFNCARCHDHKYDPLSQKDYYRFFAFFNQTPIDGGHKGGHGDSPPILKLPDEIDEEQRLKAIVDELKKEEKAAEDKEPFKAQIAKADKALKEYRKKQTIVMVMEDGKPRKTFVLNKGSYQSPTDEVSAGVPGVLPALPEGVAPDRLALARWLISEENPLTARVVMNRLWAQFFGIGLVKTTENFGVQGERPVNQALLDWLAVEFVRSGWDMKHMVRLIVTSDTYRQSSTVTPDALEKDPQNRYLARGARFRLPSWMIRDQALSISGLLNPEFGGPGVRPYQPPGVWEEMSFGKIKYKQNEGEELYRRSLYIFWRRIVAPTMFFDAAGRQVCEVKDKRTNTPLHALSTLNDPAYVEAGRALAAELLAEDLSPPDRIVKLYRRVLGRAPRDEEIRVMLAGLERLTKQYAADPDLAQAYLQVGKFHLPEEVDRIEAAAYANICLLALNLDETLTRE